MTKGLYLFKIEAFDLEEEISFEGEHTWEDVQNSFVKWIYDQTGASIEEVSYEEDEE